VITKTSAYAIFYVKIEIFFFVNKNEGQLYHDLLELFM